MDLIDDVNLVFPLRRREINLISQVTDIIHTGVRGSVYLDQVQEAVLVNGFAVLAFIVRAPGGIWVQAVDRLRQQTGEGSLARAARAGKKIGMRDPICRDG